MNFSKVRTYPEVPIYAYKLPGAPAPALQNLKNIIQLGIIELQAHEHTTSIKT